MKLFKTKRRLIMVIVLFFLVTLGQFANAISILPTPVTRTDPLIVASKTLWPSSTISVCWEKKYSKFSTEKQWVSDAVAETWEKFSLVNFTGWGKCKSSSKGIRIKIITDGPHVQKLGTGLDGNKNGMQLNFTFKKWSPSCQKSTRKKACIKKIAVHEFGHALGFAHEQNRKDTPDISVITGNGTIPCRCLAQGTNGDTPFGGWDRNSVMNYCNPQWNGNGRLSAVDIAGVQQFYGVNPWSGAGDRSKGFYVGDFNGDGKDDIFRYANKWGGVQMGLSNGLRFTGPVTWSGAGDRGKGFYVGDFNGDGKDDIFRYANQWGGAEMGLSNGVRFTGPVTWSGAGDRGKGFHVGDFNGDGKDDIFRYVNKWGGAEVMLSTGKKFAQPVQWSNAGDRGKGFYIGDFNGDGKDDLFRYINQWGGAEVMLSTGTKFGSPVNWSNAGDGIHPFFIGDFNNDGKDDIARDLGSIDGVQVMLSTGNGFQNPQRWVLSTANFNVWHVGDFDGNGTSDIFRYVNKYGGAEVYLSERSKFTVRVNP